MSQNGQTYFKNLAKKIIVKEIFPVKPIAIFRSARKFSRYLR